MSNLDNIAQTEGHPSNGAVGQAEQQRRSDEQTRLAKREATEAAEHFARASEAALDAATGTLKQPTTAAAVAGAAITGAAVLWGLAPTALGVAAGYAVYRILRRGERG